MRMLPAVVSLAMVGMTMGWVAMTTAIRGEGGGTIYSATTTPPVLRPMYTIMLEMEMMADGIAHRFGDIDRGWSSC